MTDDDEVQTIKSTSLTLSLLVMPGEDLSELYDLNPLKHNIIVSRDSGTMLHTIFRGYLYGIVLAAVQGSSLPIDT